MAKGPRRLTADDFWKAVKKDEITGCLLWTKKVATNGYGIAQVDGKARSAHRFAFENIYGPIPEGDGWHGVCVLHICDVKLCVNPAHLRLGTQKENIQDCVAKGRFGIGETSVHAKLTVADVADVHKFHREGWKDSAIAVWCGVSQATIKDVLSGKTWRRQHPSFSSKP